MARMRGPRFKKSRTLGLNVSGHPKAMDRAGKEWDRSQKKLSPYGRQLLEKQRLRGYYEVMEKQFKRYVTEAMSSDGKAADALIGRLEVRLDNLVYRLGFGSSIRQARQMVVHGHIRVNGKKIDIPSYKVSVGDTLSLREKSRSNPMFVTNFTDSVMHLPYLSKNVEQFEGQLVRMPLREEVPINIEDHLVIEYYSKQM